MLLRNWNATNTATEMMSKATVLSTTRVYASFTPAVFLKKACEGAGVGGVNGGRRGRETAEAARGP